MNLKEAAIQAERILRAEHYGSCADKLQAALCRTKATEVWVAKDTNGNVRIFAKEPLRAIDPNTGITYHTPESGLHYFWLDKRYMQLFNLPIPEPGRCIRVTVITELHDD